MPFFPTYQAALLEMHQALGLRPPAAVGSAAGRTSQRFQTSVKKKLLHLQYATDRQQSLEKTLLQDIGEALGVTPSSWDDFEHAVRDMVAMCRRVELHTWTYGATERQVLWHVLALLIIPGLAKRLAYWTLAERVDKGMPGGRFWFLPNIVQSDAAGRLSMPVAHVVEWLFGLLGVKLHEAASKVYVEADKGESIQRNLQLWMKGQLPDAQTIRKYFSDQTELEFNGCFELRTNCTLAKQFHLARAFIERNDLSPGALAKEISINEEAIAAILDSKVPDDVLQTFVNELAERYAQPDMRTIRRRFLVARMVQDGYERLLKYICPDVPKNCADPERNKILQLIMIFSRIYNLTIEGHKRFPDAADQYYWVSEQLAPWELEEDLVAVAGPYAKPSGRVLGQLLSERFRRLSNQCVVDDVTAWGSESLLTSRRQRYEEADQVQTRQLGDYQALMKAVECGDWVSAITTSKNCGALFDFVRNTDLLDCQRELGFHRLRQLKLVSSDRIGACLCELSFLLNEGKQQFIADARERVELLLKEAEDSAHAEYWQAPILQYKAKDLVSKDDFANAFKWFQAAHNACTMRAFGTLRGEIARDVLAVGAANNFLRKSQHAQYCRIMSEYDMISGDGASNVDAVVGLCIDYFHSDLHKRYGKPGGAATSLPQ